MSEISYYSASAFENNVAVARREDVESAIDDVTASLAAAEAELDTLKAQLASMQDQRDTDRRASDRACQILSEKLNDATTKVDTLHGHILKLLARAERAEAAWARCAALCDALLWEGPRPACMTEQQRAIAAARAAVDAAGDLGEGGGA